jgi:hypothetical protein
MDSVRKQKSVALFAKVCFREKKPDSIFYEIMFYLQLRKILHLFISRTRIYFFLTLDKSV